MIEIRWDKETNEIELSGTPQEFQHIRQSILHLIRENETQISLSTASNFDPAPYSGCLTFLIICKSEGPTRISISTDRLEVTGNHKNLEAFADWFDFEDDLSDYHCHFDYYPGTDWISPDSLPIVISVRS
jgi:hypothetical protein